MYMSMYQVLLNLFLVYTCNIKHIHVKNSNGYSGQSSQIKK